MDTDDGAPAGNASADTSTPPNPTTFLDLPGELRTLVYPLISTEDFSNLNTSYSNPLLFSNELSHVNRQLRSEYLYAYFQNHGISLGYNSAASNDWLRVFGKECVPLTTTFVLQEHGNDSRAMFRCSDFMLCVYLKGAEVQQREDEGSEEEIKTRTVTDDVEVEVDDMGWEMVIPDWYATEVREFVAGILRMKAGGRLDVEEIRQIMDFANALWRWWKAVSRVPLRRP